MKFGQVLDPGSVDFALPADHPDTRRVLSGAKRRNGKAELAIYVGCAKWNSKDLKGFYPKSVKPRDELFYYSTQFNSIELNATFYKRYWEKNYTAWREGVAEGFKFFPKFNQGVTHYSRLKDVEEKCEQFAENVVFLKEKLGMPFLQMHDNFGAGGFDRVEHFATNVWKYEHIPIAMEFRRSEWHNESEIAPRLYALLEHAGITNVIVDTAGRRDLLHMRLTTDTAFIRWVGANHPSDYLRLEDWVERIEKWKKLGLRNLYFFVHQNVEEESPLLAAHFIRKLNERIGSRLRVPQTLKDLADDSASEEKPKPRKLQAISR
jgi:uncharacterized protein YecE (DUF72 family)